jgi:transposase
MKNTQNLQAEFALTDSSWAKIAGYFEEDKRKRKHDIRLIFTAILHLLKTGCQWRNLDKKYPKWELVYYYYAKWMKNGFFVKINTILIEDERKRLNKNTKPSLLIIDSQSVKLAPMLNEARGIDGNKKINGRKRVIVVDTLGNIYGCIAHAANLSDNYGGIEVMKKVEEILKLKENIGEEGQNIKKILVDAGYKITFVETMKSEYNIEVEIAQKPEGSKGFIPTAKRWVVERAYGIMNFQRRLTKDYERTALSSETMVILSSIAMLIKR